MVQYVQPGSISKFLVHLAQFVVFFNTVSREAGTPILAGVRHTGNLSLYYQVVLSCTNLMTSLSSYFSDTGIYYLWLLFCLFLLILLQP